MMRASTALMSGWRKGPGISPTGKYIRALPRPCRDVHHSCRIFAGMRSKAFREKRKIAPMARAVFIVHSLSQAKAAVSAATVHKFAVTLLSAPAAAGYAGVGWFAAVIRAVRESQPEMDVTGILDCASRADLVQAAFRQGLRQVVFRGDIRLLRPLRDIARQQGAEVLRRRPAAFDLRHLDDPETACRNWLAHGVDLKKRRPSAIQSTASRGKKKRGR
jgi:hypothetical protein